MNEIATARAGFPVTRRLAYLNTAAMGPVSAVYAATLAACTQADLDGGRAVAARYDRLAEARESLRTELAYALGCRASRLYLTRSTSAGLAGVIDAIAWRPGDDILSTSEEHEACTVPLQHCAARHGVTVTIATCPANGDGGDTRWLTDRIGPATRLIVLSAVTFESGRRQPLADIAAAARRAGVAILVDGAQAAGAMPLDLDGLDIDFCAVPLQKWLCGPEGLGAVYVRSPAGITLVPPIGDAATHGHGILAAAAASLRWMREQLGWQWIFNRTESLARYARDAIAQHGELSLLTPASFAGITTLRCPAATADGVAALARRGLLVRHLPAAAALRVSTAFFNTESEIDSLLAAAAVGPDAIGAPGPSAAAAIDNDTTSVHSDR